MENILVGKSVNARTTENQKISGVVQLVYNEAIASGTNEYVNVTHVLVKDEDGSCHEVRPREIESVIE
jgi:hypothetical protein